MAIQRALLMIADIGGYTRFMKVHKINLAHAQEIVTSLLEAVLDGAKSPLKLAKLEGDAAFFYAPLKQDADAAQFQAQVKEIFRAFLARQKLLVFDQVCTCESCTKVTDLKLKFVAHLGDVMEHKVKKNAELIGMDVILVHRMLKNTVPISEYALISEPLAEKLPSLRGAMTELVEDYEGVGPTTTYYLDLKAALGPFVIPDPQPSAWRKWLNYFKFTAKSVPGFVGAKDSCGLFRNMDPAVGGVETKRDVPELEPRAATENPT